MRKTACLWLLWACCGVGVHAQSPSIKPLPYLDSLRLQTLFFPLSAQDLTLLGKKEVLLFEQAGTSVELEKRGKAWKISYESTHKNQPKLLSQGQGVKTRERKNETSAEWRAKGGTHDSVYVCLSHLSDSATKTTIQALFWRPAPSTHWKLITAVQYPDTAFGLNHFAGSNWPNGSLVVMWGQTNRGRWYQLTPDQPLLLLTKDRPTIDLMRNADSAWQAGKDKALIMDRINKKELDTTGSVGGIWYQILQPGSGASIAVSDTTTVHYKGWCLADGTVFDQTKDKPASFPLSRLIKGWQLGVPMIKVGGKVRLLIPSALAYGMRIRGAKIPPNAVLVFDIEVLSAKPQSN